MIRLFNASPRGDSAEEFETSAECRDSARGSAFEIVEAGRMLQVHVSRSTDTESQSQLVRAVDTQVRRYGRICILFEIDLPFESKVVAMFEDKQRGFVIQDFALSKTEEAKSWLASQFAAS